MGPGSGIFDLMGVASASNTMEGVFATGSSGFIFGVDIRQYVFLLSSRGGRSVGGTRTACEDFVSLFICFAKTRYLHTR